MKLTFTEIRKRVESEWDAYYLLEQLRWADGVVCPHCGNTKAYFLNPANGKSRATRTGATSQRRVWKCAGCRKQFSVLTGTIFHGTKVPIAIWLFVMVDMCSDKNGISAREVNRKYGVTVETAWHMLHRLREAMKRDPLAGVLAGTIVADETYVGGDPKNKHASKKAAKVVPVRVQPGAQRPNQHTDKTAVLALVNTETGEIRGEVVTDTTVTGATVSKFLGNHVAIAESVLHTDESRVYSEIGKQFTDHQTVNHKQGEYVRGNVTTNQAEGFFAQLKRSIDGTHHSVSPAHLHRYVNEFAFRRSTCKMVDSERLQMMIDQAAGRRLTYKPLTAGTDQGCRT
jgi:transposase-like protein